MKTLEIIPIEMFFTCSCGRKELNKHCYEKHNCGVLFKVLVKLNDNIQGIFVIDKGSFLNAPSSVVDLIQSYHPTLLTTDINEEEIQPVRLNEFQKVLFWELFNDAIYRKQIIEQLLSYYKLSDEKVRKLNLERYEDIRPKLKRFMREREIQLPLGATVKEKKYSYRATFRFGNIELEIPKKQNYIVDPPHETSISAYILRDYSGKGRDVFYNEVYGRKILYLRVWENVLIGWEEYNGHVHPRCRIWSDNWFDDRWLFHNRLGDLLFIPRDEYEKRRQIEIEKYLVKLQTPTQFHFRKVKSIEGSIMYNEEKCEWLAQGVFYHPEHGLLHVPEEAVIKLVPYMEKGHD